MLHIAFLVAASVPFELACESFEHIHELDQRTGRSSYYGLCTTSAQGDVRVSFGGPVNDVAPGDAVQLRVVKSNHTNRVLAVISRRRRLHLDFIPVQNAPPSQQRLLTIICAYAGASLTSATASETSWRQTTFGATNSIQNAWQTSSYGRIGLSETGSRYLVATIGTEAPSTCDEPAIRDQCSAAARAADAALDFAIYDHVEFYLPSEIPCTFRGLAVNCMPYSSRPVHEALGNAPNGGGIRCWSMERAASTGSIETCTSTRIHELGHNLAMQHASGYAAEYGDVTGAMGNTQTADALLYSAATRWQMGWIAHSQPTVAAGATVVYSIRAVDINPATASDGFATVVAVRCATCLSPGTSFTPDSNSRTATAVVGGTLIVSYRGPTLVSSLAAVYQSKVHVHLAKRKNGLPDSHPYDLGGTSLFAILPAGASDHIEYNGLAGARRRIEEESFASASAAKPPAFDARSRSARLRNVRHPRNGRLS